MSSICERSMLLSCRILRKNGKTCCRSYRVCTSILIVRHNVGVFAPFGCEKFSKNNHLWCSKNHSNVTMFTFIHSNCFQFYIPNVAMFTFIHSECFFPYIQKSPSNSIANPPCIPNARMTGILSFKPNQCRPPLHCINFMPPKPLTIFSLNPSYF